MLKLQRIISEINFQFTVVRGYMKTFFGALLLAYSQVPRKLLHRLHYTTALIDLNQPHK